MKYLFLDTETGGLGLEYSLLTLGMVFVDGEDDILLDIQELYMKPDNGIHTVCGEAMGINKINLTENDLKAKTYRETKSFLYEFLKSHSRDGKDKLVVAGKQAYGDLCQIWDKLMSKNTWEQFCSYRVLDVSAVFMFMQSLGYYKDLSGSLESLCNHYSINNDGQHNALTDAMLTWKVFNRMQKEFIGDSYARI